mgnify:CR=1 FL=1
MSSGQREAPAGAIDPPAAVSAAAPGAEAVASAGTDRDAAIARMVIVLAESMELTVIAEGVETAGQRDLLAAAGCDFGQGYLFARPMPAQDFDVFMGAVPGRPL